MDPDETLTAMRHAMVERAQAEAEGDDHKANDCAVDIADLFVHLDDWLSYGGFLPKLWQAGQA